MAAPSQNALQITFQWNKRQTFSDTMREMDPDDKDVFMFLTDLKEKTHSSSMM